MHFESVLQLVTLQDERQLAEKRRRYYDRMIYLIMHGPLPTTGSSTYELEDIQSLFEPDNGEYISNIQDIQTCCLCHLGINVTVLPFDVFKVIVAYACPTDSSEVIRLRKSCRLFQHAITSITYLDHYQHHPDIAWMRIDRISINLFHPTRVGRCKYLSLYTEYETQEDDDNISQCSMDSYVGVPGYERDEREARYSSNHLQACQDLANNMHTIFDNESKIDTLYIDCTGERIDNLYAALSRIGHYVQKIIMKTRYDFGGLLQKLTERKHPFVSVEWNPTEYFYTITVAESAVKSIRHPGKYWYEQIYRQSTV